jgi:peptide-methionine (R)-S-oxide reductase
MSRYPWRAFTGAPAGDVMDAGSAKNARYIRLEVSRSRRWATTTTIMLDEMEREAARSEEEWRRELTPEQYHVLREQGTEPPFSHQYAVTKDHGTFKCAACGAELFSSDAKFDSGTGWPSFTEPAVAEAVELREDRAHGMVRTEVVCRRCGSHLGHVFDDGPGPTGLRYCINGVCLVLEK